MTTTQQNVPVLRFKDEQGNDYLEWEEKRLGEICSTFKSGNGITMSRIVAKGNSERVRSPSREPLVRQHEARARWQARDGGSDQSGRRSREG